MKHLSPLLLMLAIGGCDLPFRACTLEARSSFAVTVVDSITAVNLAPAATVRVTEGTFSDTLFAFPPGSADAVYGGVHERAGVYAVTVTHPAYATWQRSNVRVREDECHVTPQVFTARLRPKP